MCLGHNTIVIGGMSSSELDLLSVPVSLFMHAVKPGYSCNTWEVNILGHLQGFLVLSALTKLFDQYRLTLQNILVRKQLPFNAPATVMKMLYFFKKKFMYTIPQIYHSLSWLCMIYDHNFWKFQMPVLLSNTVIFTSYDHHQRNFFFKCKFLPTLVFFFPGWMINKVKSLIQ